MSPTLLEGVVVIIVLFVAWQIGIHIAPFILRAVQRSWEQLSSSSRAPDSPPKSLTDKEHPDGQP